MTDTCKEGLLFPHVHKSVSSILVAPTQKTKATRTCRRLSFECNSFGKVIGIQDIRDVAVSLEDLVDLASQADDLVYSAALCQGTEGNPKSSLDPWLVNMGVLGNIKGPCCSYLLSLLVALNLLESAIRSFSNGSITSGKAPLLKDMLEGMKDDIVASVCKTLLLPSGLNLRNLVWHGFVEETIALRPWLALVLVIIQIIGYSPTLKSLALQKSPLLRNAAYVSERCRRQMNGIIKEGEDLQIAVASTAKSETAAILSSAFVPTTHVPLLRLALDLISRNCPILASILLVVVLEHSLRLLWCKANRRPNDSVASPGRYYVTLDGHGQRSKHDVILHYTCGTERGEDTVERNELCGLLGGSTMALLTDLFISGSGGPNLRAALAHGVYDDFCLEEIHQLQTTTRHLSSNIDIANSLLASLERVACSSAPEFAKAKRCHVPVFSFAATTADVMLELFDEMEKLNGLLHGCSVDSTPFLPEVNLSDLRVRIESLLDLRKYLREPPEWREVDLYEESNVNAMLLPLTAARTLVCDALEVARPFVVDVKIHGLEKPRMKTRLFHMTRLTSFAMFVALCNMEDPSNSEGRKAVERTRMVLSTVATFIFKNDERSFKALREFVKGKHIKAIIAKVRSK